MNPKMNQMDGNIPTTEDIPNTSTDDSRFCADHYRSGSRQFFGMYSENITVEADDLASHEVKILRALVLQPFVTAAIHYSSFLAYTSLKAEVTPLRPTVISYVFSVPVYLSFIIFSNLGRIICTICCLLIELCAWPIRVILGAALSPITTSFSLGHVYAFSYSCLIHSYCSCTTTRRIKVKNSVYCRIRTDPASFFGKVLWFQTRSHSDASYITAVLKIQQRCGTGPEGILLDGKNVFVSWWRPWTITNLVRGRETEWSLWDVQGLIWRRMLFEMHYNEESEMSEL